jgi:hypothetical protein
MLIPSGSEDCGMAGLRKVEVRIIAGIRVLVKRLKYCLFDLNCYLKCSATLGMHLQF